MCHIRCEPSIGMGIGADRAVHFMAGVQLPQREGVCRA